VRSYPDHGNSGLERRFVCRVGTNRAYNASMGGIVASSSSPRYYGRQRGDLTPVISGLSGWTDTRMWVTSQGGLERTNRGAASEASLGRGGDGYCRF
jgi:hypothetical protein